jgi:hypothetical protein
MEQLHLLDTTAAAEWLTAHGVRRTPATLRKLRCLGNGPRYRVLNAKPYYLADDLLAWIDERLSAPLRNSAERAAAAPASARQRPRPESPRRLAAPAPHRRDDRCRK